MANNIQTDNIDINVYHTCLQDLDKSPGYFTCQNSIHGSMENSVENSEQEVGTQVKKKFGLWSLLKRLGNRIVGMASSTGSAIKSIFTRKVKEVEVEEVKKVKLTPEQLQEIKEEVDAIETRARDRTLAKIAAAERARNAWCHQFDAY